LMFRFSIFRCVAMKTKPLITFGFQLGELFLLHLKRNERIGNVVFRDEIDL
jgi:hypothetical protein